ncbi:hypothetical protein GQ43DRAFT_52622 [Delitschia confertaspora ATCC 74209]|uniref:Uncharacterized protein n=1 Tax=Delitschia confertaspora ATCC 74209 TaxID=1513339 RepID=A0A9P4MYL6_9PLEO|nr:hypothetical protein GQ43DRAFT_52622 [Delitschia confertaspora ATCC 74209]
MQEQHMVLIIPGTRTWTRMRYRIRWTLYELHTGRVVQCVTSLTLISFLSGRSIRLMFIPSILTSVLHIVGCFPNTIPTAMASQYNLRWLEGFHAMSDVPALRR